MALTRKRSIPVSGRDRTWQIKKVLWVIFFLNIAVAAAKFFWGLVSGSASMQADGIHSVFDSTGNIVGLVGMALASRPADDGHPYGHSKFETYASVCIGLLLLFAAYEVGSSAIGKLASGVYTAEVSVVSFVVMLGTLAVNIGVTTYERRCAKKLKSEVLAADASHTLSDAMVSIGVIIGLVFVKLGFPIADPIMALVVMVAILFTAFGVFKQANKTLSDESRLSHDEVKKLIVDLPGVRTVHRIRSRGTEGEVYVDLHVLVDPMMTVVDAHDLTEVIEAEIVKKYPSVVEVLVHVEPDDGHEE